jgi:hypothetical protein
MKHLTRNLSLLLSFSLLLASCSGNTGKFVGRWKPTGQTTDRRIIIEQKGKTFDFYPDNNPQEIQSFDYDSDHDCLTMNTGKGIIDIRYDGKTEHLVIAERGDVGGGWGAHSMELERAR